MKVAVAVQTVALVLAGVSGVGGQEVRRAGDFPELGSPVIAETTSPRVLPLPQFQTAAADQPGFWKSAAVGAGVGAVAGGTAGYLLYPNAVDPWFTRWQFTGVTAAQGAVAGAAVGALVALLRRTL